MPRICLPAQLNWVAHPCSGFMTFIARWTVISLGSITGVKRNEPRVRAPGVQECDQLSLVMNLSSPISVAVSSPVVDGY